MIYNLTVHNVIRREHMVVLHIEMITVVILLKLALTVMRWIDIHPAIEHMDRRISHIITRNKISWFHYIINLIICYVFLSLGLSPRSSHRSDHNEIL